MEEIPRVGAVAAERPRSIPPGRLFGRLVLVTIISSAVQSVAAMTLTVGSTAAPAGSEFTVPVRISEAMNVATYDLRLSYDSEFVSFVSASTSGTATSDWMIFLVTEGPDQIEVLGLVTPFPTLGSLDEGIRGDATLFNVTFRVQSGASGASPLILSHLRYDVIAAASRSGVVWTDVLDKTLFIGGTEGIPGTEVTLPLILTNLGNVETLGLDIEFDDTLLTFESMSTTKTHTADWAAMGANEVSSGVVRIGAIRGQGTAFEKAGLLCYLTFGIQHGTLGLTTVTARDLRDDLLGATVSVGSVSVRPPVLTVLLVSASVRAGSTIAVPIHIADASGVGVFSMQLNYDTAKLVYRSVSSAGALTADWSAVGANATTPGELIIGGFRGAGTEIWGSGTLMYVLMNVVDGVSGQTQLTLTGLSDDLALAAVDQGVLNIVLPFSTAVRPSWSLYR